MTLIKFSLFLTAAFVAGLPSSFAKQSVPLLTVDVKSYEALKLDIGLVADAVGEEASSVTMPIEAMLGPDLLALIDPSKPWHAALWMESMVQAPVIGVVLPISDFEAFESAIAMSALGLMGAQYLDLGDTVVLYGSNSGVPVADSWKADIESYAAALSLAPLDTVELTLQLNDSIKAMMLGALAMPKAQMMAAFDDSSLEETGLQPELMKGMMEAYFSFYEAMLRDMDAIGYNMSVTDEDLRFAFDFTPVQASPTARFIASQDVDIADLAFSADWGSDICFVMGLGVIPEEWQPSLDAMMQAVMPLYGLEGSEATAWVKATNASLPLKGVYNMDFNGAFVFDAYYELLDTPAAAAYDQWLALTEDLSSDLGAAFYSDISLQKSYRTLAGQPSQSVDRLILTLNPEHPSMQMPEQKAMMEKMFQGGKMAYEMALVDNRIYMASEGRLESAMAKKNNQSPITFNENTRMAGTLNIISMMEMGSEFAGPEADLEFSEVGAEATQLKFSMEMSENLVIKTFLPLKLFKVLSDL